jgi:hypothetical protein
VEFDPHAFYNNIIEGEKRQMPRFYKGIGLGTFHHGTDLTVTGLHARMPGSLPSIDALMHHIANATTTSPYISLTRSYGVAFDYAISGRIAPTATNPAFVYEIDIPNPQPTGMTVIDPVAAVAAANSDPVISLSYHHNGNSQFLLGVVDPVNMAAERMARIRVPPGSTATPGSANLTLALETFVRALRDAEVLVLNFIPNNHVIYRHPAYL